MKQPLLPLSVRLRASTMLLVSQPTTQICSVSSPTWPCNIHFLPTQPLLWRHQTCSSHRITSSPTPPLPSLHSMPQPHPTSAQSLQQKPTLQRHLPTLWPESTVLVTVPYPGSTSH